MSPYRRSAPPPLPLEGLKPEPDPFPTITCFECSTPTTKVANEVRCARCDLAWLFRCSKPTPVIMWWSLRPLVIAYLTVGLMDLVKTWLDSR
jgi:hypothetical protein